MNDRMQRCCLRLAVLFALCLTYSLAARADHPEDGAATSSPRASIAPADVGVAFVEGSSSQIIVEKNGKRYLVDAVAHTIHEADRKAGADQHADTDSSNIAASSSKESAQSSQTPPSTEKKNAPNIYEPGDDLVFSVPTGRRLDRHGFYVDFTHRFPYSAAFSGQARGAILLGLDDIAVPSFGFRYGVTSKFSVAVYRSPSLEGRPIELMAAYNFLDEHDGQPFNAAVRLSVDGQNNFSRNFSDNFELIVSKSITHRMQVYAVPTVSINDRPLLGSQSNVFVAPPFQPCGAALASGALPPITVRPCANTFSLGLATAVDVRPTVALVAEAIPTLANGRDLGIHRPEYAFGIQKKIWRHAFTFGFTNGPGTTVSQRAGTRATYLGDPTADKPSGLFIGFDLSRQIY